LKPVNDLVDIRKMEMFCTVLELNDILDLLAWEGNEIGKF
jgi:hypothetical protein